MGIIIEERVGKKKIGEEKKKKLALLEEIVKELKEKYKNIETTHSLFGFYKISAEKEIIRYYPGEKIVIEISSEDAFDLIHETTKKHKNNYEEIRIAKDFR